MGHGAGRGCLLSLAPGLVLYVAGHILLGSDTLRGRGDLLPPGRRAVRVYPHLPLTQGLRPLGLNGLCCLRQPPGHRPEGGLESPALQGGAGGVLLQCLADGVVHRLKHRFLVGEFHLQLGRVDIHIHPGGVQPDIHDTAGVLLLGQVGHIGLLQCRLGCPGLDISVVDEEILPVAVGLHIVRPTNEAVHRDTVILPAEG